MKKTLLLTAAIVLSGCMTTSPKTYDALTQRSHFVFEQDIMLQNKLSIGLAKGRYEAIFESKDFIYYLGESKSLILNDKLRINGGIAIPKSTANLSCHLFLQVGDDSKAVREMGMGPVVSELAKLEAGRIREFKDDPKCYGFLQHIHAIND